MSDKHPPVVVLPATPPTFGPRLDDALASMEVHASLLEHERAARRAAEATLAEEREHADQLADLLRVYRGLANSPIWNEIADFVAAVDVALVAHEARRKA